MSSNAENKVNLPHMFIILLVFEYCTGLVYENQKGDCDAASDERII
jgi:hypothetical protein